MKEIHISKYDDLTVCPSDELNEKTLSAMRMSGKKSENSANPHGRVRKWAVCAVAACASLVLMGMGVRVFEYLTYVPGMGIVTAQQDEVYTLESVVEAGAYRIEAMSMLPVTEGENEGMWQVTLLTNKELPKDFHENPEAAAPIYFLGEDGESYTLSCSGGSGVGARYTGYAEIGGEGEYTVKWGGTDYTVTMKSMENSVWANYSYPVDQGMTVIAFPLAENSKYMVFDVILDPESENMAYWAEHSESIWYQPHDITITDAEGNTYSAPTRRGSGISIPESEMEYGVNSLLSYKMETILTLDSVMKAPLAKVEIGRLELDFKGISDTGFYTVTVPELDEIIDASDLPNDGIFFDSHGLTVRFTSAESVVDESENTYEIWLTGDYPTFDFEENVVQAHVLPAYIRPADIGTAEKWEYYQGSSGTSFDEETGVGGDINFTKDIVGYGDRKIRTGTIDVTFGDEIAMCMNGLRLYIDGEWTIDFTAEKTE